MVISHHAAGRGICSIRLFLWQGANWNGFYQNLAAMNQMLSMVAARPDSANYTNAVAMLKVLRAYQAIELSNFYGDIPYSKAGKGLSGSTNDLTVPYDKQQAVYLSCLKDLTWAVNNFNTSSSTQYSFGSSEFLLANNIAPMDKIRQLASFAVCTYHV